MKAIIVSNDPFFSNKLDKLKCDTQEVAIMGVFPVGLPTMQAIKDKHPAFVLMEPDIAYELNEVVAKSQITATIPRRYISASTHHGMQILPISTVYFFQAEHKYVVAYHEQGELLINDSLASLEREFTSLFIRIHRKILVAKEYIKALEKTGNGYWQIILINCPKKLIVSRRQLAMVRKYIIQDKMKDNYGA
jgi:two-component system response regulator AlgR